MIKRTDYSIGMVDPEKNDVGIFYKAYPADNRRLDYPTEIPILYSTSLGDLDILLQVVCDNQDGPLPQNQWSERIEKALQEKRQK